MSIWKKWQEKKKKDVCNHYWKYIQDDYIPQNVGCDIILDKGSWIYCPKCDSMKLVPISEWVRIKYKQDVLSELELTK